MLSPEWVAGLAAIMACREPCGGGVALRGNRTQWPGASCPGPEWTFGQSRRRLRASPLWNACCFQDYPRQITRRGP